MTDRRSEVETISSQLAQLPSVEFDLVFRTIQDLRLASIIEGVAIHHAYQMLRRFAEAVPTGTSVEQIAERLQVDDPELVKVVLCYARETICGMALQS